MMILKDDLFNKRKLKIVLSISLLIGLSFCLINPLSIHADDDDEDDDDDDEDIASALGWASVALFAISSIYIVLFQIFKLMNKITEKSKMYDFKKNYSSFFRKVRKPFLYIHYISGLFALGVLLAHGILLTKDDVEAIIGWITAGIYIFYILSGILLWFKIIHPKRNKKLRKTVLYIHRSLIIFAIAIVIHVVHLAISD